MEILNIKNKSLRHAVTSLISVLVSTLRGIEYITNGGSDAAVVDKVIKILKEQDNGNVTQRFCLAILQKCSVKDSIVKVYWDNEVIPWVLSLVKKSLNTKIHMFCLDFATAMLANLVHSRSCQASLERRPETVVLIIDTILKIIKEPPEKIEVSVLMHLLITLSYLCRDRFKKQIEETHLQRRIAEFVDFYENTNKEGTSPATQKEKRPRWTSARCSTSAPTCSTARRRSSTRRTGSASTRTSRASSSSSASRTRSTDRLPSILPII